MKTKMKIICSVKIIEYATFDLKFFLQFSKLMSLGDETMLKYRNENTKNAIRIHKNDLQQFSTRNPCP